MRSCKSVVGLCLSQLKWLAVVGVLVPGIGYSQKARTVKVTPERIEAGRTAFAMCAGCHGLTGEGLNRVGPKLNCTSFLAAASDAYLTEIISNGRAGTTMIGWGGMLGADTVKSIVAYMRSWQKTKPAKLDESPLKGNAKAGKKIYAEVCSTCHGMKGTGYLEGAEGTAICLKGFLDKASNGFLRYTIAHGKTGTNMKGFGKKDSGAARLLTKSEIDDVISFLRENPL